MFNFIQHRKQLIILLILFVNIISFSKEFKVVVFDKDIDIPLEGVTVVSRNPENKVVTDFDGVSILEIDDDQKTLTVICMLIGYENKKVTITNFSRDAKVEMVISGVIEGKELVIEEKKADKKDEKSGVSTVIDTEMINSSAMIGPVEDIMSSIKTLPGVSYAGKFSAMPSVRGGAPSEMTATLDGFLIRNPYHWGGAYSIFNPNMIDSVKFSNGIIPVKYGNVMSGLIEVNSVNPNEGFKLDAVVSTTTTEIFAQIPLWDNGKKSGMLLGTRQTYLDPILSLVQMLYLDYSGFNVKITTFPYIRDGILKWFIKPTDRTEFYVNVFSGNDGVGIRVDDVADSNNTDVSYTTTFNYFRSNLIASAGIKALPKDNIFIHFMGGYEMYYTAVKSTLNENATITGYNPIDFDSAGDNYTIRHSVQSRLDVDFNLTQKITFSCGASLLYDYDVEHHEGNSWQFITYPAPFNMTTYQDINYNVDSPYLNTFLLSTYLNFNFIPIPGKLNIDLGARVDYFFLNGEELAFQTIPVVNPRASIQYTPVRNYGYLKELTFSGGVGLFSKVPGETVSLKAEYGIKDFQILQPQVLTAILGMEVLLPLDFKIKLEGYYKFYFNRFYVNSSVNQSTGSTSDMLHSDGIGHAAGFDILVQRSMSRYIDGWISYSFIFARYLNPETDGIPKKRTSSGNPTGDWYYPSYHRYHNLNIVLDIKPTSWFTITPKFTFATGNPKSEFGTVESINVMLPNQTKPLTMYTRDRLYNDESRNGFEIPFDLKIAFHFYFPKSKVRFETYAAVEDLFVFLYEPTSSTMVDKYTGKEIDTAAASFRIPFPIPSIGIKVNF